MQVHPIGTQTTTDIQNTLRRDTHHVQAFVHAPRHFTVEKIVGRKCRCHTIKGVTNFVTPTVMPDTGHRSGHQTPFNPSVANSVWSREVFGFPVVSN